MTPISRRDAATRIRDHWLTTRTPEQLLAMHEPRWERMRNYELERVLESEIGGEWVISEWCPFNGVYCAWVHHCPIADLDALIATREANPDELRQAGVNPDMHIGYLRGERQKRKPPGSDNTND